MKIILQRVTKAKVSVAGQTLSEIGNGLLILLGVAPDDDDSKIDYLVEKISNLRIFSDEQGKMNLSLIDVKGAALIVSQFTLFADCEKGRRPSFTGAADPAKGEFLYKKFIQKFKEKTNLQVGEGQFGADMDIELINSGPVTIEIEK